MYRTHFLSKHLQKIGEYKHYAAILSHLKNKSKTEYYNMQFVKYKDNLKQTWKLIGTLVKRKTKGQTFPTRITHNNRTFTQEKDIAELFNNFFVNIGPTLAKEIKTDHTDPLQYIESTPSNSFYLAPVTQTQVFKLFAGLKGNKASLIVPNKLINRRPVSSTGLTAARLAQLGERRSAEREVASSNPGRTNTQGLKNN